ncbi:hypothetical protein CBR_g31981 [Chara braunii]|uniref:Uncharacterized protein n=1 Tax=Chara braunii TaxID=69332 RepID=A0A388LG59_CHABU|nr:hypothetical protein CBR_g31981 [Chara braunii]|eukprot:GBG81305.1 hypothetical protein CBR_g31981 [Chara braunii]
MVAVGCEFCSLALPGGSCSLYRLDVGYQFGISSGIVANALDDKRGPPIRLNPKEPVTQEEEEFDVVILSNGPGEVAAWVRPVVRALRRRFGEDQAALRISVVLAPCPHASGTETAFVQSFKEVDRCQAPGGFPDFLLWGKTTDNWDWRSRGVCIFLGGDQFNALLIGWRLGYKTVVYAEDAVRWAGRCRVIGDLFADAVADGELTDSLGEAANFLETAPEYEKASAWEKEHDNLCCGSEQPWTEKPLSERRLEGRVRRHGIDNANPTGPVIGLLPGSKKVKLMLGIPFMMSVADNISKRFPGARFVIPLAPTVDLGMIAEHADSSTNPVIEKSGWASGTVIPLQDLGISNQSSAALSTVSLAEETRPDGMFQSRLYPKCTGSNRKPDGTNVFQNGVTEDVFEDINHVQYLSDSGSELSAGVHRQALARKPGNEEGRLSAGDSDPVEGAASEPLDSHRSAAKGSTLAVGSVAGVFETGRGSGGHHERDAPTRSPSHAEEQLSSCNAERAGRLDLFSSTSFSRPHELTSGEEGSWQSGLSPASVWPGTVAVMETAKGTSILVCEQFPPYELYAKCTLCLTTMGTNTAELGSLGVPMVVILPSVGLEVFRGAVGGILGLFANLPGEIGKAVSRTVNTWLIKSAKFIAWPNRWAKEEIVPELIGEVTPADVADVVLQLLIHQEKLDEMRSKLLALNARREEHPSRNLELEADEQPSVHPRASPGVNPRRMQDDSAPPVRDEGSTACTRVESIRRSGAANAIVHEVARLVKAS